jgi:hypothetical protein
MCRGRGYESRSGSPRRPLLGRSGRPCRVAPPRLGCRFLSGARASPAIVRDRGRPWIAACAALSRIRVRPLASLPVCIANGIHTRPMHAVCSGARHFVSRRAHEAGMARACKMCAPPYVDSEPKARDQSVSPHQRKPQSGLSGGDQRSLPIEPWTTRTSRAPQEARSAASRRRACCRASRLSLMQDGSRKHSLEGRCVDHRGSIRS